MSNYDFHQLSPYDLEILARDLLQAHWGVAIESFKAGKDGGVDLRYAAGPGRFVVQVKHFLGTGLAGLLRKLKDEAGKVRDLKPERYVLVTSVGLSAANKDAIVAIFGTNVLQPSDVIGQEDLNNLLDKHPDIEGKHYKLWLASRAVLDRVLHNAAVTKSEFKARQVHDEARRYVQSGAFPKALKMLNEERVVIIAGPPGVGKSTLANLLLYEHLERGYQAILIQRDIEEGQSLFQLGIQQVFYFDDFMGATFLGDRSAALSGTSDRALLDFIAMVRATPTARLILTTREHIYSQAMDRSERLRHSDLDDLRVFLRMPSYSFMQKARILYNHLVFSELPTEYQDALLRNEFYLRIIKHEKFNPRLVEWLSTFRRLRNVPVERYRAFVENLLRDPSEIWRHAYEQEITDAGRSMLLVMFSMGGKVAGISLKPAFTALHHHRARRYGFHTRPEDFRSALRQIAGSFIKPLGAHDLEVIDPSVLDLLNSVVCGAPDNAIDIMTGAVSFEQIERVWSFATTEKGSAILDAIRHQTADFVATIGRLMLEGRPPNRGLSFERRLAIVVGMAHRLASSDLAALITPLFARLGKEWETESLDINDTVELLRALDGTSSVATDELGTITSFIETALLREAIKGCRSDELRELIGVIDTSNGENHAVMAARSAFESYQRSLFERDLLECRSREQFNGLIEDLELFRDELGVNVAHLLERAEEVIADFEDYEEQRADHLYDEWKERSYDERDNERSVTDMFGSMRDN